MQAHQRRGIFRRLPIEEQRKFLAKERLERERREREAMTDLSKRPVDLRPRLQKKDGAIV